jgi:hypothetical protein
MFINEIFEGVNPDQGVATYQQLLLAIKENRATEIDGMTITESQAKYLLKEFKNIAKQHGKVSALEFLGSYGEIGKSLHKHAVNQAKQLSESLNEISDKTIDSYYDKVLKRQREHEGGKFSPYGSFERLPAKRQRGIDRATKRILRPEWDPTDHNDIDEVTEDEGGYNDRNPKIDLFHKDTKEYLGSTNWYKNTNSAVAGYVMKHPELKGKVIADYDRGLDENLHKWFKEKWVRFGPDGKIRGDCARGSEGEGKPKCLPQKKAQALGKKKRASAAAKKRREDPNPERKGKAKNVATKVKEQSVAEVASYPTLQNRFSAVEKKYGDVDDKTDKSWTAGKARSLMKKISRTAYNQHGKLLQKGVSETVTDVKSGMAEIYHRLAPKIERNRDSFLAGQLYDELENYAELHGAEDEFKRMMNGARNRAHMEYDTNPGGFHNWFWFLPFEDNNLGEEWSEKYKKSINCSNPKGFSQKAHCAGRKKTDENFADGKKPGRKGLAKRVGVNCKQPISKLRSIASNSSGEKQRMAHWCANMKSGKQK